MQNVAIFWDYENCPAPSNASGYALVDSIRAVAQTYGMIKSFRAYSAVVEQISAPKAGVLRSELQCSGVSLVDCPHNGRKDVADKMMIVDMLAHTLDNAPSSTVIFLISGDRDFAYAMSVLKLRCYTVVLCAPNNAHASLLAQASKRMEWASIASSQPIGIGMMKKQLDEESPRKAFQGFGSTKETYPPLHDVGTIVNSNSQDSPQKSASPLLDARGGHSVSVRESHTPHPSTDLDLKYALQLNLPGVMVQSNLDRLLHESNIVEDPPEQEFSASNSQFGEPAHSRLSVMVTQSYPPVVNARTLLPEPTRPSTESPDMARLSYQRPVTTPLVLNQRQPFDSSLPEPEVAAKVALSPPPNTEDTSSDSALPITQEITPLPNSILPGDSSSKPSETTSPSLICPELGATKPRISNDTPIIDTGTNTVSKSVPASSAPLRKTPPPHFTFLVRTLQLHRAKGMLKLPCSLVSPLMVQPSNGNPYKKAGVGRWGQYVELARKAGIVEVGGRKSTAWVALAPEWHDAILA